MAISETYVDPSIAGDSGAGTVGDPYGDLQYALDTMTRDGTNGDRINIKAGTDEVLGASLDLSTYGTPANRQRLVLQGYTTAAGDGGIGGISGNGSYTLFASSAVDYISLIDLHIHNVGSNPAIWLDNGILMYNCEVNNANGGQGITFSAGYIIGCHVHDVAGNAIYVSNTIVYGSSIEYGSTYTPGTGIYLLINSRAVHNTVKCSGAMTGIKLSSTTSAIGNSVWSNAGTGIGIQVINFSTNIINNIVEGFSGVGGVGIKNANDNYDPDLCLVANAVYNCTTLYSKGGVLIDENNDTAGSSPFTDPANGDFSLDGTVTGVTEDAFPATFPEGSTTQLADKGAVQEGAGAGGGGGRQGLHPIESGAV